MCARRFSLISTLTAVISLLAALLLPTVTAAATEPSAGEETVTFAGVTVRVPAGWPVVDVDDQPGCVRYDEHAVFLGVPSESDCPPRVIGRTTTVQILRPGALPATGDHDASTPTPSVDTSGDLTVSAGDSVRVIITGDGSDDGSDTAARIAESVTIDGAGVADGAAPSTRATPQSRSLAQDSQVVPRLSAIAPTSTPVKVKPKLLFSGKAFDACTAQPLDKMTAWKKHSPYDAVGIYVGGIARGCAQPLLTSGWVATVQAMGWRLLPLYVGRQAPCTQYNSRISTNLTTAAQQGSAAATDAVVQMRSLGLLPGNPVYLDMESWSHRNEDCSASVMAFTDAWTVGLNSAGYLAGFYSSAGTGVRALVAEVQRPGSTFHTPDALWFASWDGVATTSDDRIPDTLWANHQRVKQYLGGHNETYGGQTINIDSSQVDAPVAGTVVDVLPTGLADAIHGQAYSRQLSGTGGQSPYSYALAAGQLPKGLKLSANGRISGTPTAPGYRSTMTVSVRDASAPTRAGDRIYRLYVSYADMPTSQPFYGPVKWLSTSGITYGYPDGTFRPEVPVTRGAMAAFLYRWTHPGKAAPACTSKPFPDVQTDDLFCGHISWLKNTGLTFGYPDGTFKAESGVTRGAMAAFLYRFTHPDRGAPDCTKAPFPDVQPGDLFCGHISWMDKNGLAYGYDSDGTFRPSATVTRGAMAAFIKRIDGIR